MPASRNRSSSEAIEEQKINVSDSSSGDSSNVYNFDAHPLPKNSILIAGNSMINGIDKKASLQTLNHFKSDVLESPQKMACTLISSHY